MNTLPLFTAEFSLYTANDHYKASRSPVESGKIVPQQMRTIREAGPGPMCHCPCCVVTGGELYCCG